jgi:uncharacterized protein YwqG
MPRCKNDKTKIYKGNENSPKGFGYSATGEEYNKIMMGKDNNLWIVKKNKIGKKWDKFNINDIDFSNLSSDCYTMYYLPIVSKLDDSDETGREEKFGGTKPFFIEGESWPTDPDNMPMVFLCQFKDPNKYSDTLYRVFIPLDNINDTGLINYNISKIELSKENIDKQIIIEKPPNEYNIINNIDENCIFVTYKITKWNSGTELKSLNYLCEKFNIPKYNQHTDNILYNNFKKLYYDHNLAPLDIIKIGGTPVSTQNQDSVQEYNLLQLTYEQFLPYGWGDSGIAHISNNCKLIWDCF